MSDILPSLPEPIRAFEIIDNLKRVRRCSR